MLDAINQVKKWFKENIDGDVPDGEYLVPIYDEYWKVTIKDNAIFLDGKVVEDGWDAYGPT